MEGGMRWKARSDSFDEAAHDEKRWRAGSNLNARTEAGREAPQDPELNVDV
jgi:hypothetical protein